MRISYEQTPTDRPRHLVDAASIAYWRSGEGPPLVLVHGTSAVAILDFGPRHLLDESPLQKPYLVPMTVRKLTTILVAQAANGTS